MLSSTHHRLLFTLAAAMLGGGCVHGIHLPRAVASCGTPAEVYMTTSSDEDGREMLIERILPARGNCEDILITWLRYDERGSLSLRADEHLRCGVVEESVVASREGEGWTLKRSRDLDHDDRMDERSVSFVPAASFERLVPADAGIACAIAQSDGLPGSALVLAGARNG